MTATAAAGLEPTETDLTHAREVLTSPGPLTTERDARARAFSANRGYLDFLRTAHGEGDRERVGQVLRLMTAVERVVDGFSPAPLEAPESSTADGWTDGAAQ